MDKLLTEWRKYLTEVKYVPCKTPATGIGLKKGCKGENVEVLQTMLEFAHQALWKEEYKDFKLDKIKDKNSAVWQAAKRWARIKQGFVKPDGFFGLQTEIAVRGMQILFNLQDTGVIDKKTFLTINRVAQQARAGAFRVARAGAAVKAKTIAGALPRGQHAAAPFGEAIPAGAFGARGTKE
jgi:hypothetical protein